MKSLVQTQFLLLSLFATFFAVSCVDQDFDEPPVGGVAVEAPENLITIAALKAKHTLGQIEKIEDSVAIEGVVIADDQSGNYFKTLVIQDATAGIEVKINTTDLYNDYPIGQQIYVQLKGMYIGDYRGLTHIGGTTYENNGFLNVGGIEEVLIREHISKGKSNQAIEPEIVTIEDLNSSHISRLIQLEHVQFTEADAGKTFADSKNKIAINLNLEDCTGSTITLRTSGYADFASLATPTGSGAMTAIYSVFGETKQLFIRTEKDLRFTNERCDGTTGGGGGGGTGSLEVDFQNQTDHADIQVEGWQNISLAGDDTRKWIARTFQGNVFAQATAFQDKKPKMDTWLISPALDLSKVSTLSFETAAAFWTHEGLSVLIATDYNGTDTEAATWQSLSTAVANEGSEQYAWVPSGEVDLSEYSGTAHIAFRFVGTSDAHTGTFRLDNIVIK